MKTRQAQASNHTSQDPGAWARKLSTLLPCMAILAGCASTPVIVTQRVTVPQFVPIPINLLETPDLVFPAGSTWGQVEGIEYQGLQACRGQLQAISRIQGTPQEATTEPPQKAVPPR